MSETKREQQALRLAAVTHRISATASRPRVWLLEDSPFQALQTKRALARHDILHFTDGAVVLEQLAIAAPDVLILDWELTGISGHDVLRFVRAVRDEVTLPVLVLTSDERAMMDAFAAGANDFVAKPCPDVVLEARLQALIRVHGLAARTRAAEQDRTDALERVYDAETRMYVALEEANIGTWELDLKTRSLQLDPRSQTMLNVGAVASLEEVEQAVHPEDRALFHATLESAIDPDRRARYAVEYRVVSSGGEERWFAAWAGTLFAGGEAVRLVGALLDITERKHATAVMERDALFRERFIAILAHDLRTPLTALRLGSQLLTRRAVTEAAARELGLRIEATTRRMDRMIADLLDFTRSRQGGGMPVVLDDVDLEAICRSVVQEVELAAPERSIVFTSHGDTRGRWDGGRLQQIVSNLVCNAIDYSPANAHVAVTLRAVESGVQLQVQNPGVPIPAATLLSLFDPFRRGASESTSSTRSRGLGLGLYIVEQIARAHSGSVSAQSDEKDGTTFSVSLPR